MKKWLLFTILVCFSFIDGGSLVGNQTIGAKVDSENISLEINQDVISSQDVIDNQITVKNPTFEEVKEFILEDATSRNQFVLNKYECRHFATEVNNNADAAGIRCAFVLLCYRNGQHAVVAFETTDRGMIYIEPQTDAAIQPIVGGSYQGQEIIEILVSW